MRRLLILAVFIILGFVVARARRGTIRPPERPAPPAWVDAVDGQCPPNYPVKAKMNSGIYHVPGGAMYARTHPDRCYRDPAAAEADGLRPAKR